MGKELKRYVPFTGREFRQPKRCDRDAEKETEGKSIEFSCCNVRLDKLTCMIDLMYGW